MVPLIDSYVGDFSEGEATARFRCSVRSTLATERWNFDGGMDVSLIFLLTV